MGAKADFGFEKNRFLKKPTSMFIVLISVRPVCKYCSISFKNLVSYLETVYFDGKDVIRVLVDELMGPVLVDDWDITKAKFCRGFSNKGSRDVSDILQIGRHKCEL